MNIENKVVVVTGAASGIGRALAQAFKNARADKVYIADLNEEGLAGGSDARICMRMSMYVHVHML